MNFDNSLLLNFISKLTAIGVTKFMLITIAFMYIFFAFALWRQLNLMTQSVKIGASPIFKTIGVIHLLLAIGVFILGFIML